MDTDANELITVTTRLSRAERDALVRLARRHDRTPSRELRRAVRHYLADPHAATTLPREDQVAEQ